MLRLIFCDFLAILLQGRQIGGDSNRGFPVWTRPSLFVFLGIFLQFFGIFPTCPGGTTKSLPDTIDSGLFLHPFPMPPPPMSRRTQFWGAILAVFGRCCAPTPSRQHLFETSDILDLPRGPTRTFPKGFFLLSTSKRATTATQNDESDVTSKFPWYCRASVL